MDESNLTLEELRELERYFSTLAPFEFLVKARKAMRELIAIRERPVDAIADAATIKTNRKGL